MDITNSRIMRAADTVNGCIFLSRILDSRGMGTLGFGVEVVRDNFSTGERVTTREIAYFGSVVDAEECYWTEVDKLEATWEGV